MTRRELVQKALRHQETERLPYHLEFTGQAQQRFEEYMQDPAAAQKTGGFLHYWQYWGYPTEQKDRPEHFTDDFGVTWNRSGADKDIGVIDEPVIPEPDISLYPAPFLDEARIRADCERLLAAKEDRFCFAGIGFSLFERLWSYVGMENALVYMITDPDFVDALLDKIVEFNLKVIDIFNEYPFDGIYFGDDWGQQQGMIMGAPLWRRFFKPRLEKMYRRAKQNGRFVLQHSCGDIREVLEDLVEIGLDCYQTVQPEIYDLPALKQAFAGRLCFWGGISTQRDLPVLAPQQLAEVVRQTAAVMGKGGGYILAPTHALPQDIPPENVLALLEIFQNL